MKKEIGGRYEAITSSHLIETKRWSNTFVSKTFMIHSIFIYQFVPTFASCHPTLDSFYSKLLGCHLHTIDLQTSHPLHLLPNISLLTIPFRKSLDVLMMVPSQLSSSVPMCYRLQAYYIIGFRPKYEMSLKYWPRNEVALE